MRRVLEEAALGAALLMLCFAPAILVALSGCTTPVAATVRCIPLTPYTAPQEAAIGAELATLADADPLADAMADYTRMRAADAACMTAAP